MLNLITTRLRVIVANVLHTKNNSHTVVVMHNQKNDDSNQHNLPELHNKTKTKLKANKTNGIKLPVWMLIQTTFVL